MGPDPRLAARETAVAVQLLWGLEIEAAADPELSPLRGNRNLLP